ncbi:MAG TPA: MoaD/ThiS family protein [Thermoleophilia bacterium]|nr:MoaD/ThiS family protein [Thermoleophilia bacterium]
MRLSIKFCGILPSLLDLPASEMTVDAAPGSTLGDVMRSLNVREGPAVVFAVNGKVQPPEFRPQDGDEIAAIPSIAGG